MTAKRLAVRCAIGLACLLLLGARPLPAYHADLSQTTVSGLSSGAYMAGQFAVIHSSIVSGVALVAGGPYYCSGHPGTPPFIAYIDNALSVCMNPALSWVEPPDSRFLWDRAQAFAQAGLIDDVGNLQRQAVYLFSGKLDHIFTAAVVDQAYNFYRFAGAARLRMRDDVEAGHGMITDDAGDQDCAASKAPYFNNCHLRLAEEMLAYLYPELKPASRRLSGRIVRFDQRPFAARASSMADTGYAYVPAACARLSCRVHVAFHGCLQHVAAIGDHFYARAGYNLLADANKLIVLYPQVEPSQLAPYNPLGCWDFWGYASPDTLQPDFHTRNGVQVRAVRAMLDRLAAPRR
ncbi:MAG: poly(3-hydroxybutyrate) depolymerase [Pseudomonadota bacterium]